MIQTHEVSPHAVDYFITVSSVDFGWGGSGALGSIITAYLSRWSDTKIGIVGSELGRNILKPEVTAVTTTSLSDLVAGGNRPHLHLSVLDAESAKVAAAMGIRSVFVDLLPFLWGKEQRKWVPKDVDRYLYQDIAGMDRISPIVPSHAIPIEAIIDPKRCQRMESSGKEQREEYALLILGGLLSPQQKDRDGYVRAITSSVVQAIRFRGYHKLKIIGNLSPTATNSVSKICAANKIACWAGYVTTTEFGALVDKAALVLGQPGLMTLLEVSASGRPFVRLPPQNVAGFVQTTGFNRIQGEIASVSWPEGVIDHDYLEYLRAEGESVANAYCYAVLNSFTAGLAWDNNILYDEVLQAIDDALAIPSIIRRNFASRTGDRGAEQVAQYVRQEICKAM